ncbi:unnamed protein product [Arctia plantaginis]|uniref:Phenoloxidase-activating factor 2 n=1 Tax=Arctia plantaginis TaxID=874455 RepID=A0A8S1BI53_ARCPL|nr:unnamed protein product [Arctia plantaginis]
MLKALLLVLATASSLQPNEDDVSCTLDDGSIGECVPHHLCDINRFTVETGLAFITIYRNKSSPCLSYLDTCCPVPAERPPENPITPKRVLQTPRTGCGWRNSQGADLRTTGEKDGEAKFGEFPWMVAVMEIKPVNPVQPEGPKQVVYVGGGSLISLNIVLTAAHIVARAKSLRIRAGEWDTQTTKEIYPFQDRDVASVEIHKDFNGANLFFDVALLFLTRPVDSAPHVGVVCLPSPQDYALHGTRCFATGWGKEKFGKEGRYQTILRKVELPVVEHNACQTLLRMTRLSKHFKLHSSFICAGGERGPEICKGDGGSPLSCPIEAGSDRYMQSGIAAWRIGCGDEGNPGTYGNVAYLRDWIDEKVIANGFSTQSYIIS